MFAIYLRVSTDRQQTNAQKHDIYEWCSKQGYDGAKLLEYVDEGITGSTTNRPGLQKMLDDVRKGTITKIITFESSRLSRDFMDFLNIMALLSEKGVELEIPNKGLQGFGSSTEKLLMAVQGFVSSQFLEDHSKRVRAGMAHAKKDGKRFGAPMGNTYNKGSQKHYDAKLVAKVMGLHAEGLSTRKIGKALDITHTLAARIIQRHTTKQSA